MLSLLVCKGKSWTLAVGKCKFFFHFMKRAATCFFFFFLNDPPPPEISPLSLPAALPICGQRQRVRPVLVTRDRCGQCGRSTERAVERLRNVVSRLDRPRGGQAGPIRIGDRARDRDRKSTRLNSSHSQISYAVFCLKKKKK